MTIPEWFSRDDVVALLRFGDECYYSEDTAHIVLETSVAEARAGGHVFEAEQQLHRKGGEAMKADLRRRIADRAAELAVDKFDELSARLPCEVLPEELLQLQHDIEDELYREMAQW